MFPVLSRNEIREIVTASDSDEEKYYPSQESEDEEEPLPPSRRSSISQPFVLPKLFSGLSYKVQLIRHPFVRPPYKHLKPQPQYK